MISMMQLLIINQYLLNIIIQLINVGYFIGIAGLLYNGIFLNEYFETNIVFYILIKSLHNKKKYYKK